MPSFSRWIVVLLYAFMAVGIFILLGEIVLLVKYYYRWLASYAALHWSMQYGLILVGGILSQKILLVSGTYHEEHDKLTQERFKLTLVYPSIRWSIIIGVILALCWLNLVTISDWFRTGCIGLLFWFGGRLSQVLSAKPREAGVDKSVVKPTAFWWQNESPVTHLEEDEFNRVAIVNRLHANLQLPKLKRQVLAGGYGTGKSSILKFLEEKLTDDNPLQWLVVHFNAWGKIDEPAKTQALILDEIIAQLSKKIDTCALQTLPENYHLALKGNLKALNYLLHHNKTPRELLEIVDNILSMINKKVVVFVEDIDRNNEPKEACNSVAPLLDKLSKINNITFIFTIEYSSEISDITNRIAEYREDIPPFNPTVELASFIKRCHNYAQKENITLFCKGGKKPSGTFINYDALDNLGKVFSSPRILAATFRVVDKKWRGSASVKGLAGNFNFDDLLVLSTLKEAAPLAYDFVHLHSQMLNKPGCKSLLDGKWELLMKDSDNLDTRAETEALLKFIFPHWNSDYAKPRIQSIAASDDYKSYWDIYCTAGAAHSVIRDDRLLEILGVLDGRNDKNIETKDNWIDNNQFDKALLSTKGLFKHVSELWLWHEKNPAANHYWFNLVQQDAFIAPALCPTSIGLEGTPYDPLITIIGVIRSLYVESLQLLEQHVAWALQISLPYLVILANQDQNIEKVVGKVARAVFIDSVKNVENFKTILNLERKKDICFFIEAIRNGGTEIVNEGELHKVMVHLFKLITCVDDEVRLAVYGSCLRIFDGAIRKTDKTLLDLLDATQVLAIAALLDNANFDILPFAAAEAKSLQQDEVWQAKVKSFKPN